MKREWDNDDEFSGEDKSSCLSHNPNQQPTSSLTQQRASFLLPGQAHPEQRAADKTHLSLFQPLTSGGGIRQHRRCCGCFASFILGVVFSVSSIFSFCPLSHSQGTLRHILEHLDHGMQCLPSQTQFNLVKAARKLHKKGRVFHSGSYAAAWVLTWIVYMPLFYSCRFDMHDKKKPKIQWAALSIHSHY